jgi:hypothetical protein
LKAIERFVDLAGGGLFGAAIDFSHEEDFVAIAVAESLAHPNFAAAIVVVPTIVHEINATIDGGADDSDPFFLGRLADVIAADPDDGDLLAGASQSSFWDFGRLLSGKRGRRSGDESGGGHSCFQKLAAVNLWLSDVGSKPVTPATIGTIFSHNLSLTR